MLSDAEDIYSWGLDEIREDWAYVSNYLIDPKAFSERAERLNIFDRALKAHDAWVRLTDRDKEDA